MANWNAGMDELLQQARKEDKWLFTPYQGLWFSPDELEAEQANGRFRWGVVNWKLRNPHDKLESLKQTVVDAERAVREFEERMNR